MNELVGLLPAAGRGTRLGAIPCSKEIMPLGFQLQSSEGSSSWQPVTAIETHLRALRLAGARRAAIVVGEAKFDIVRYLGSGARYGLSITYLYQEQLRGMPFALDLATPWIGDQTTLFSMPDTLITPTDTMARVAGSHRDSRADLTLGLFSTSAPHKFGMVELDEQGRVHYFVDKPVNSSLRYMWGIAAWSPRFSRLLAGFLAGVPGGGREVVLSDAFQTALDAGLEVQSLVLDPARYHDIGTPEDFQAVVYDLALQQAQTIE